MKETNLGENQNFFKDLYINFNDIGTIVITYKGKEYIFDKEKALKLLCKEIEK